MKYYKLKKSLPTFEEGDIFELGEDGSLRLLCSMHKNGEIEQGHWKDKVIAYNSKTLKRFPNILRDWFEEIEVIVLPEYMRNLLKQWAEYNKIKQICCSRHNDVWSFYGKDSFTIFDTSESYTIDIFGNFDLNIESYHYYLLQELGIV